MTYAHWFLSGRGLYDTFFLENFDRAPISDWLNALSPPIQLFLSIPDRLLTPPTSKKKRQTITHAHSRTQEMS